MSRFAFILALLAAAGAAWAATELAGLQDDLQDHRAEIADLRAAVDRLGEGQAAPTAGPPPLVDLGTPGTPRQRPPSAADQVRLEGRDVPKEALVEVVRDLRDRLRESEARQAQMEERLQERSAPQRWRPHRWIGTVDQLAQELELTGRQRADVASIVDETKQRLEDLRRIPNDEGRTWADVSKPREMSSGEGFRLSMPDLGAIQAWRQSKVPGSNETYGEAETRIKEQGQHQIRDVLDESQRESFDEARTDALFGAHTGVQTSVVTFGTAVETTGD